MPAILGLKRSLLVLMEPETQDERKALLEKLQDRLQQLLEPKLRQALRSSQYGIDGWATPTKLGC